MGTYKGIQGYMVESLASDPGTLSEVSGKLWYNSGSNVWKIGKEGSGAWASGGDVNTGRINFDFCGTQTAALISLGDGPLSDKNRTEEYDGTTWVETNNANTPRQSGAGFGTQTAGVDVGGHDAPNVASVATEEYNGSNWTTVNDCNTGGQQGGGAGILTAGMWFGRFTWPTPGLRDVSEAYDGTTWTNTNSLNTARYTNAGGGTATAAITAGGSTPAKTVKTETYNGTSWTEVTDMNSARGAMACSTAGTTTSYLVAGGVTPGITALTELYNGTSWTEVADLATARTSLGGAGTGSEALAMSGSAPPTPGYSVATEEWDSPNYEAATVTTS